MSVDPAAHDELDEVFARSGSRSVSGSSHDLYPDSGGRQHQIWVELHRHQQERKHLKVWHLSSVMSMRPFFSCLSCSAAPSYVLNPVRTSELVLTVGHYYHKQEYFRASNFRRVPCRYQERVQAQASTTLLALPFTTAARQLVTGTLQLA